MKKQILIVIIVTIALLSGFNSCQDYFLEKPDTTGTVDMDAIFSSTKNAEAALFYCYRQALKHGWPTGIGISHATLASISGEQCRGYDWFSSYAISNSGLSASGQVPSNEASGTAGADCMPQSWEYIRASFIVKENIKKVPDMNATMKTYIEGEATALIAYRYMGMFYRYGGVPIVKKSFNSDDDLNIPRASLQETLDYIIELCDTAYSKLPDTWSNIEGGKYSGRITKGVALAIKARALMYAARPLFNSATPYLDLGANNNLICFGNQDPARWQEAIKANEAVLTWANANGYRLINTSGATGQPNPNAADDYGNACSKLYNEEILLDYRIETGPGDNWLAHHYNYSPYWNYWHYDTDMVGLMGNFLDNYCDKNGNDIDFPKVGESAPRDIQDWVDIMNNIEPRFRIDFVSPGVGGLANPTDNNWMPAGWGRALANIETRSSGISQSFPDAASHSKGCSFSAKFYYQAGSRTWFHPPLFRLAETYLHLAEAYNESGNTTEALKNLNIVHNRAGLPAVTETNKEILRKIIWREKAVEFFHENQRYYDVKHWKHPDIGTEIIGGQRRELQFLSTTGSTVIDYLVSYWMAETYVSAWFPRMYLEPFHQNEINKGIIIQNPGY